MPTAGGVMLAADWGILPGVGSEGTNGVQLRAMADAMRAGGVPGKLLWGVGTFYVRDTDMFLWDVDDLTWQGEGPALTAVHVYGPNGPTQCPLTALGVHDSDGGKAVLAAHRPDPHGVLDAGLVPSAGTVRSFRTNGDAFVTFLPCGNSLAVGPQSPSSAGAAWGYWGYTTAITFEACVTFADINAFLNDTSQPSLAGVGNAYTPGPFFLASDGAGKFIFAFGTADGGGVNLRFGLPTGLTQPYHFKIYYDLPTGAWGVTVNGAAGAVSTAPGAFAGKSLYRNSRSLLSPFFGPSGGGALAYNKSGRSTVPDFTVWAARLSDAAHAGAAADDTARYGLASDTVWRFPDFGEGVSRLGRPLHVQLNPARCNGYVSATGLIQQVNPSAAGGVARPTIRGMTVAGGGGVALGQFLNATLDNVAVRDGTCGLSTYGIETTAYPLDVTGGCEVGGSDRSVSIYNVSGAPARFYSTTFTKPGSAYVTAVNCELMLIGSFTTFTGPEMDCAVDAPLSQQLVIISFTVDNEDQWFGRAVVRAQRNPAISGGSVFVRGLVTQFVGPAAYAYLLEDRPGQDSPAHADLGPVSIANPQNLGLLFVDKQNPASQWYGSVEPRAQYAAALVGDLSNIAVPAAPSGVTTRVLIYGR